MQESYLVCSLWTYGTDCKILVSKKSCCDRFVLSELTRKLRLCWICLKPYMPTRFECCFYSNPESNHRLPLNERQSIIDQSNVLLITTWSEHLMVPNGLGFQHKRISFFIKKKMHKKNNNIALAHATWLTTPFSAFGVWQSKGGEVKGN